MRTARPGAVAACLLMCGFSLIACGTTPAAAPPPAPVATSSAPVSAEATLSAALDALTGVSYDFRTTLVDSSGTINKTGSVDSRTSVRVQTTGNEAGTVFNQTAVEINGTLWFKLETASVDKALGIDPTKWMSVDLTTVNGSAVAPELNGPDLLDAHGLLNSVGTISRTDSTHLAGTFDLTAAPRDAQGPDPAIVTAAGAAAKAAPFTVVLDSQGRIAELSYTVPGTKISFDAQYSSYGSPDAITAPDPSTVIPMPNNVIAAVLS